MSMVVGKNFLGPAYHRSKHRDSKALPSKACPGSWRKNKKKKIIFKNPSMIETDMAQRKRKEKKKAAGTSNAHKYHTICCTRTIVPRPREESKCKSSTVMQSHNVGKKSNEDRRKSKKKKNWQGERSKEEEGKKQGSKTKITFPALALRLALRTKSIFLRLLQARNPLRRAKRRAREKPYGHPNS